MKQGVLMMLCVSCACVCRAQEEERFEAGDPQTTMVAELTEKKNDPYAPKGDPKEAQAHGEMLESMFGLSDQDLQDKGSSTNDIDAGTSLEEEGIVRISSRRTMRLSRYTVEGVEVEGNDSTADEVILHFVKLSRGDVLEVDDPKLEDARWRLFGTGWFSSVDFRLRRGKARGHVVVVIHVRERNTFRLRQIAFGISEGLSGNRDRTTDVVPYGGFTVSESNLLGMGFGLSLTTMLSEPQQGFLLSFRDPFFLGSEQSVDASIGFNNARQFFGENPFVSISCSGETLDCPEEVQEGKSAVVFYHRTQLEVGTGRDIVPFFRYRLGWHLDFIDVRQRPDAASEVRGSEIRPIDFAVENGQSIASVLKGEFTYERKNDPVFPSKGIHFTLSGDAANTYFGSDYNFLRLQTSLQWWIPLYKQHSLRISTFVGAVVGNAPFFYRFHVEDFTDLIPARILEMSIDRRRSPNFFRNAIEVMKSERIAASLHLQYNIPSYVGEGWVRKVNGYVGFGIFSVADPDALELAIQGYSGARKVPLDMTFDVGIQLDTEAGVFQFGFSNFLGLVAL